MDLNFRVFATGVRIFRANNDVGPLCVSPGSTRILEKTQGKKQNDGVLLNFLLLSISLIFWKINGWNALTLWVPISCCATGLLSYSYYFAYIPPTICSQDRLSTKAEVYFGISQKYGFDWLHKDFVLGAPILLATSCTFPEHLSLPLF